ncbi:MAG: haloalkane dehalogenase [Alphaproteobacteria bacterium]|jgi:haloalkane dehalogenase|nr:haloalkane dehalogenase [Alphaproteobacteria bacterium]MDP6623032.1 haloalkane dehalogenase [Alphaproteobacteria bacterium]|tara:strand:+ start:1476 stop:2360 length:885 start_codon:yes stop_codon:yes gene_type:complete
MISSDPKYERKFATVNGKRMAYVDEGEGDPIVFQHGNPTSSYLWRNVMPHCAGLGRLIACDLIGMGDSEKLDDSGPQRYSYTEHRDYLFALWDQLGISDKVIFVIHDWGSALGFDWANQNRDKVQGIAYMEAVVKTMSWAGFNEQGRSVFQGLRSEAGENLVLEKNLFVEHILPGMMLRDLSDAEMAHYRKPYLEPGEDRRPTLTWPRMIPIDGEPPEVCRIVEEYGAWLSQSDIPKLFVNGEPGAIIIGPLKDYCRTLPNQTEITVKGVHYLQEDSPDEIGQAVAAFVKGIRG